MSMFCSGTPATPNRRCGCAAQKSAIQSLYATRQSFTNSWLCSAWIGSTGPKNIACRRVHHGGVDVVDVERLDPGIRLLSAGNPQRRGELEELARASCRPRPPSDRGARGRRPAPRRRRRWSRRSRPRPSCAGSSRPTWRRPSGRSTSRRARRRARRRRSSAASAIESS